MWLDRFKSGDIYLSGSLLVLADGGQRERIPLNNGAWQEALSDHLRVRSTTRWRVWLGGSRCQLALEAAIPGAESIEEAEAMLGALRTGCGDSYLARLAAWQPGAQHWPCVYWREELQQGLLSTLDALGMSALSIRPWWSGAPVQGALTAQASRSALLVDDEAITQWCVNAAGEAEVAGTHALPDDENAKAMLVTRLQWAGPYIELVLNTHMRPLRRSGFAVDVVHKQAEALP